MRHPDLRFVIAGRNPPPVVREMGESPNIEVTGTVDDVRPWYRSAFVVVVPLRTGSGTRLKILEAMAAGVPVVSTRLGAEGLDVTDGLNIILAESPQETMAAVDGFFKSPERWHAMAEAGRALVRDQYDWSTLGERLYEVHHALWRQARQDSAGDT
jgi:glycosyltransferase involved in cell wall biosynthesis